MFDLFAYRYDKVVYLVVAATGFKHWGLYVNEPEALYWDFDKAFTTEGAAKEYVRERFEEDPVGADIAEYRVLTGPIYRFPYTQDEYPDTVYVRLKAVGVRNPRDVGPGAYYTEVEGVYASCPTDMEKVETLNDEYKAPYFIIKTKLFS